jgi:hypothetical protein
MYGPVCTLIMVAIHTSETSVNFNMTTWCYIPEDSKLELNKPCTHLSANWHIYITNSKKGMGFQELFLSEKVFHR